MHILFCCEFYAPSKGGVQEVIKQVADRLVLFGHDVTVATRKLQSRNFDELNGVKIVEFKISGNLIYGLSGELDAYRHFVVSHNFDIIVIKAAQQCTFDALWPVLNNITVPKVFIPCGFSGLYDPAFTDYFHKLPDILRQFDHLIFYASDYRDINFTRENGINNFSIIPNGASEVEFSVAPDPSFRKRYGIGEDDSLFLTVGSFTGRKGHFEVVSAFEKMKLKSSASLILNGNVPVFLSEAKVEGKPSPPITMLKRLLRAIKKGPIVKMSLGNILQYLANSLKAIGVMKERTYTSIAEDINKFHGNKKVLITDLSRPELVQAFMAADLFIFASNIEYSPLVLYECAAAGTPFLSGPVGNSEEIAQWTGGGQICPANSDREGNIIVDPAVLAKHMSGLVNNKGLLLKMGADGKKNWSERFTWGNIATQYQNIFKSLLKERAASI